MASPCRLERYEALDDRLTRQDFVAGDTFRVADAYAWATVWHRPSSGVEIAHLGDRMTWKARLDARPSVIKALKDDADVANRLGADGGLIHGNECCFPRPHQPASFEASA